MPVTGNASEAPTPVLRFAPSPNGELHLGHALSALTGFELSKRFGGRFLLRIEDIDIARARPEFVAGVFEDLRWLGIAWEEPVLVQSEHFDVYRAAADMLRSAGVLYPCFATRSEIAAAASSEPGRLDPDGAPFYPGLHRGLSAEEIKSRASRGEPFAYRIDMEKALALADNIRDGVPISFVEQHPDLGGRVHRADPARWGDAVIVRKDVPASYHLAVVVDDARQGVTHVTRGHDLYAATDLHRLLQVLLGLPEPVYHHHRLIADGTGRKLSKSARDTSLRSLRNSGVTADAVRASLGFGPDSR